MRTTEYETLPPAAVILAAAYFGKALAKEIAALCGEDTETVRLTMKQATMSEALEVIGAGKAIALRAKGACS